MKKSVVLILTVILVSFTIFYLKNWAPAIGIVGKSMEPSLKIGDFIIFREIPIAEIKKGDIIVFRLPKLVKEHYNYPPIIAHRVIEVIQRDDGVVFKTKGDSVAGNDPFIVRPIDIKGTIAKTIPYAGLPSIFLQSKQGLITIITLISLYGLATYSQKLSLFRHKLHKEIFSPIIEEQKKTTQTITEFTVAIADYAKHLQSHTEVMKNLAKTTESLKDVVEKLDEKLK